MIDLKTVQELNRALSDKLANEGKNNPQAPYYGKKVGIANGQVVVVADDLDELVEKLLAIEPDTSRVCAVEVGRDYDKVHYV